MVTSTKRSVSCLDVSENSGTPKSSILYNRVFHYKPSILGYPYFWKHPFESEDVPLCYDSQKKKQLVNGKGSQASLGMLWEGCFPGSPRSFPFGTHTFFGANKETHQHQSSCVQFSYPIRWYRRISGQSRSTIPLSFPVNSHDFQKILRKLLVVFLKINDLFRMILEVSEFRSTSFPAKLGSPNWSRVKRTPINTVS